jgi:hypothetical protein
VPVLVTLAGEVALYCKLVLLAGGVKVTVMEVVVAEDTVMVG